MLNDTWPQIRQIKTCNLTIVQNFLLYSMFMFLFLGYVCEEHDNPADFLLDVINQCEGQTSATAGTKIK